MVHACFHEVGVEDGCEQMRRDDPKKFLRLPGNEWPKEWNEEPKPREYGKEAAGVSEKGVGGEVGPGRLTCQSVAEEAEHGIGFFVICAWIVAEDIFERSLYEEPENDLAGAVDKKKAVLLPYFPEPKGGMAFGGRAQEQGEEGDGDETSRFPVE